LLCLGDTQVFRTQIEMMQMRFILMTDYDNIAALNPYKKLNFYSAILSKRSSSSFLDLKKGALLRTLSELTLSLSSGFPERELAFTGRKKFK